MIGPLLAMALVAEPGIVEFNLPGGSGYSSCATWLSDKQHETHGSEYILGAWAGINLYNDKNHFVGASTDAFGIIAEVKLVCQAKPSSSLFQAMFIVYRRMESEGR